MNKVNVLPPDVVAKIAAGEAVDRPASVVKELLENAIDAGATSIEINLQDAGKELIHIKDNGCGISHADLQNIFRRHATSKISTIDNLEQLRSFGFRGEALYSIAAVSDIVLTSRTPQYDAWQIHIMGSKRQNLQPAALAHTGTDIKISELFFNTPARRKFLKNNSSELNQIVNAVLPYTLIYPQKRFVLTHAGRGLLDLRPAPSALDRAAAAINVPIKHLFEAGQEFTEERIQVKMVLGNMNVQRPTRHLQFIFINDRPVESKNLNYNLNDVYKLVLPPGVFGAFIVNISLDPANVDVNIHPTKREVRLKDEGMIIRLLRRMTEHQLMTQGQAPALTRSLAGHFSFPASSEGKVRSEGLPAGQLIFAPGQLDSQFKAMAVQEQDLGLFAADNTLRSKLGRARFVGAFLCKFLLFEGDNSLLIVDQHAAQERIMFEKFKKQIESARVESQPLLTPLLLKVTVQEKIAWEQLQKDLCAAGIETTQFDEETIAVQSQPLLLKNIENVVRHLLAGGRQMRMDHNDLARRACKASIVAGDKIDASEADWQRRQLLECQDPFTCPHGRPTVIEMTHDFLDRQFLRT